MKIYYLSKMNDLEYYSHCKKDVLYYLGKKEILILPTDTIHGLSAIPSLDSIERVHFLKKRFFFKRFIYLYSSYKDILNISNQIIHSKITKIKIPITLIIKGSSSRGMAVRVPQKKYLKDILNEIGMPILSTSINEEGQRPLYHFKDILVFAKKMKIKIVVIDDMNLLSCEASSIIDIRKKPYKVVRKGKSYFSELVNQIT